MRVHWCRRLLSLKSISLPNIRCEEVGMWKELRIYVVIAASALLCVVLFFALRLASSARSCTRHGVLATSGPLLFATQM